MSQSALKDSQEEIWLQNRRVVLFGAVLVFGGFTLVMSFLPLYLRELGITDVARNALWSGVLIAITPLMASVMGPLWGSLADRYGLKPMVMRATVGVAISWVVFATATEIWHLAAARVISGLFGGYNALLIPLISVQCPRERLNQAVGSVTSARIASLALGPLVGGLLADWVGVRSTATFTAFFGFLSVILFLFFYRVPSEKTTQGAVPAPLKLTDLLKETYLFPLFALLFLVNFFDRGITPIIPLMVLQLGTPLSEAAGTTGIILFGGALASTVSSWWVGRQAARWHLIWLLRIMAAASTLICVPLIFSSSNLELGLYRSLLGLSAGGVLTAVYLMGTRWIPSHSRASGMAILTSGTLLGNALGPITMGLLASFGLRVALSVGILTFLLLLWVAFTLKPSPDQAPSPDHA